MANPVGTRHGGISILLDETAAGALRFLHVIYDAKKTELKRVGWNGNFISMTQANVLNILISEQFSVKAVISFALLLHFQPSELGLAERLPTPPESTNRSVKQQQDVPMRSFQCAPESRKGYAACIRHRLEIEPQIQRLKQIYQLDVEMRGHREFVRQLKADREVIRAYAKRPDWDYHGDVETCPTLGLSYGDVEEADAEEERTLARIEEVQMEIEKAKAEVDALFQFVMKKPYVGL